MNSIQTHICRYPGGGHGEPVTVVKLELCGSLMHCERIGDHIQQKMMLHLHRLLLKGPTLQHLFHSHHTRNRLCRDLKSAQKRAFQTNVAACAGGSSIPAE